MLHHSKQLSASFHAELYRFIPENHPLRKIHSVVDFSFIRTDSGISIAYTTGDRQTNRSIVSVVVPSDLVRPLRRESYSRNAGQSGGDPNFQQFVKKMGR